MKLKLKQNQKQRLFRGGDSLDSYEYMEECPDYVKEDEDNENN